MANLFKMVFRHFLPAVLAGVFLALNISNPLVAQPRPLSIYFEYQKSDMTTDAKELVASIKGNIKKLSRVTIVGHCDTSESDPDKLSLGRALEVQKELVALGLPAMVSVTIVGRATTELRTPTGPNVREPRNRVVSITIE